MARNEYHAPHLSIPCSAATRDWTGSAMLVYNELWRRSRFGKHVAYGGRVELAKKLVIGEQTARRALRCLEAAGAIKKVYASTGGRRSNGYRVVV